MRNGRARWKPRDAEEAVRSERPAGGGKAVGRSGGEGSRAAGPRAVATAPAAEGKAEVPFVTVVDAEQVRAAVTVALDASIDKMVDEITRRVLAAMRSGSGEARAAESRIPEPLLAPAQPGTARPASPPPGPAPVEAVRRVTPLRIRSGSILGLDISRPENPGQDPE